MKNPEICIIAAISENRVIGRDNQLPWNIPDDLKRFRELTTGHPVVMGRRTFGSIGRPLPERTNIVVSRNLQFEVEGIMRCGSLGEALSRAGEGEREKIFIIGGGQIYRQTISLVDRLYLTVVRGDFPGDTYFPEYGEFSRKINKEQGSSNGLSYTFLELTR